MTPAIPKPGPAVTAPTSGCRTHDQVRSAKSIYSAQNFNNYLYNVQNAENADSAAVGLEEAANVGDPQQIQSLLSADAGRPDQDQIARSSLCAPISGVVLEVIIIPAMRFRLTRR
jgi:hypothetical protein